MKESAFRRWLKQKLESKGWLVFTLVAPVRTFVKDGKTVWMPLRGQLFDLAVFKNGYGVPIEVKSETGYHSEKQMQEQVDASVNAGTPFVLIRKSEQKRRIKMTTFGPDRFNVRLLSMDLQEYLEDGR